KEDTMRYMMVALLVIVAGGVLYITQTTTGARKEQGNPTNAQPASQQNLRKAIEMAFLQYRARGQDENDRKEKIEQLGSPEEVTAILRELVAENQYAREESIGFVYLTGATWMLGEMGDKQAEDRLAQMIFDPLVHENIRAQAVRSLGSIDANANKDVLLKALRSDESEYLMIRVYAAEGLARIKEPQVLTALEQAAQQETDPFILEKFHEAAQKIRSNQ